MPNVELTKPKLSSWRKIALGSWHAGGDPSVYGVIELDATRILARQKKRAGADASKKPPTLTAIVARAAALTLAKHPEINGLIRWGRIYNRKTVTLFLQTAVDDSGKDLSGVSIFEAERKSLDAIVEELAKKARAIREDKDPSFRQAKSTFSLIPPFLTRYVLNTMSFLLYTLNLDLRWIGLPKDPFGSVMITSIGSLGLDEAFAPLVAYSRVPLLLAIGAVRDRPTVIDGKLAVAPLFKMCVHGAKMVKHVSRLLQTDEGLDEVGL
jgi:hypothetical protein